MPNRPQTRSPFDPARTHTGFGQQPQTGHARDVGNDGDAAVTWRFYRAANQAWRWERITGPHGFARHSSRTFTRYEDCVRDAQAAGYKPMSAASRLVPLSLVSEPQAVPRVLSFDTAEASAPQENRSTVLKKRVIHPAIERMFGRTRSPALTRRRTSPLRQSSGTSADGDRAPTGMRGKNKTNRT
ncbi:MAG TPA: hypothetical protein VGC70_15550 [Burkholderiales bacterium]